MNRQFFEKNNQYLLFQRNLFAAISLLLSLSLIITSSFLFLKRERVVISPPVIEKEFWVDAYKVSPTYLEQMAIFLSQNLLSKSPSSASTQRTVLLRYADPSFFGALKQKLIEEEEVLKKQNASYVFYTTDVRVDSEKMRVFLVGDRIFFASGKQVASDREGYILNFTYHGSKLLLAGIEANDKFGDLSHED